MLEINDSRSNNFNQFSILILLGFFIWNKYRYDAISIAALVFLVAISSLLI